MIITLAQYADKGLWFPDQASTFSEDVDWLYLFITWVSVVFTVLIMGALIWFVIRYRMKPGDENRVSHGSHHNNALEVTWSVIPLLIVLAIFVWGFRGFLDMQTPPGDSYEVWVDAKKWNWTFQYPSGRTSSVLVVPANRPIKLTLNSQDVIHSFFVPAFRAKKDAVPGRYNTVWFEARWDESKAGPVNVTPVGVEPSETTTMAFEHGIAYDLYCTEYCGTKHSWMTSSAVVLQPEAFEEWVNKDPGLELPPIVNGERLWLQNGCNACHSADGSQGMGPTFRNIWGRQQNTNTGPVTVDADYIRESTRQPGRQIVEGYANVMPAFNLSDRDLDSIMAWMKSITEGYGKTPEEINAEYGWTGGGYDEGAGASNPDDSTGDNTDALPPQQPPTQEEARQTPSQQQEEQTGRSEQGVELQ